MKTYIGTKIIQAEPAPQPGDRSGFSEGYKVVYPDGHVSWSPEQTFQNAYREISEGCMTFGLALEALKLGKKVARLGWNGKGMWLSLTPGNNIGYNKFWSQNNAEWARNQPNSEAWVLPCITMKTSNASGREAILMGWAPSQTDMLSEDWVIVP